MNSSQRILAVAITTAVVAALVRMWTGQATSAFTPPPLTFSGPSTKLNATLIVPTLDTPIPATKNVVWCSTFGVAWKRLQTDVVKQPILVDGAAKVAARLNALQAPEADLPEGSYYAAAGMLRDGVISRIQKEMADKFPNVSRPTFEAADGGPGAAAYAYLGVSAKFNIPFLDDPAALKFKDSKGSSTPIRCFGVTTKYSGMYRQLRSQVAVLYAHNDEKSRDDRRLDEYAIDLCRTSQTTQVIVAVVPRKTNLAETVSYLDAKIAEWAALMPKPRGLGLNDSLHIPILAWHIVHRFSELEGKAIKNPALAAMPIVQAEQMIEFRLDRNGADLGSEAKLVPASISVDYAFNRPYLIYMKKRAAKRPFFVMWVDNAELLSSFRASR